MNYNQNTQTHGKTAKIRPCTTLHYDNQIPKILNAF
jgi:hypothetical protein